MKISISIRIPNSEVELSRRTNGTPVLGAWGVQGEELAEKYKDALFECLDLLENKVKED